MLELLVLGQLLVQPKHGYRLKQVLDHMLGPRRQVHWSALYPLLARLEEAGLIRQEAGEEGRAAGPPRRVYRVTEAGRRRFLELMRAETAGPLDAPPPFHMKVPFFSLISREKRLALLREYRDAIAGCLDHVRALVPIVTANAAPDRLRYSLKVLQRRTDILWQELAWVEAFIAEEEGEATDA